MSYRDMTEIEKLRHFARISGDVNESLWDNLTRAECLAICDAWMSCGWDFYPDQWTRAQLTDAIRYGIAPDWRNDESPITYEATEDDIYDLQREPGTLRYEHEQGEHDGGTYGADNSRSDCPACLAGDLSANQRKIEANR